MRCGVVERDRSLRPPPAIGLWPIRTAVRAAGSGDATCRVRLSGIPVVAADYAAAVQRVERVLPGRFDAWRTGDAEGKAIGAATGTLDWVFAEYRADPKTRRNHELGFVLVGGHVLKDGRRLGEVRLTVINTAVADAVYERLLVVTETVRWVVAGGREFSRKKSALPRLG